MGSLETLTLLMSIATILVAVSQQLRIPYPLALVLGGALLGFTTSLSAINFDPYTMLVIVLPPLLYYAAFSIPFKEFWKNLQEILGLALGLVLVTTVLIGLLFKWLFPELPWALAFTFGAIISPPDAIAATTVLKLFSINTRLLTVLEGESLINDATGLVLYKLAVVALLSGTFSVSAGTLDFFKVAFGGIVVGAIVGYPLQELSRRYFDPILTVIFSFLIPYITYLIADALEISGVLAVVTCALIGSRMLMTISSSTTRLVGWLAWDVFIILLNCFIFILMGLQLRGIVDRLTIEKALVYIGYGFLITLAMIAIRFFWIYARTYLASLSKSNAAKRHKAYSNALIMSWSGMRGIVSLTIALALPYQMLDGTPLKGRDEVLFLTFVVILLTLLITGLTLSPLMKVLNIQCIEDDLDRCTDSDLNTLVIRQELTRVAQEEIHNLLKLKTINEQERDFLLDYFHTHHQMLEISSKTKTHAASLEVARIKVLAKKREHLVEMWEQNIIDDQVLNALEREIDLDEAYLARALI